MFGKPLQCSLLSPGAHGAPPQTFVGIQKVSLVDLGRIPHIALQHVLFLFLLLFSGKNFNSEVKTAVIFKSTHQSN